MADHIRRTAVGTYRWLEGKRTLAVGLALILVAIPTAAALFPGYVLRTDRLRREIVMVVWLLVAVVATVASKYRESEATKVANSIRRAQAGMHRNQIRGHLGTVLDRERCGIPSAYGVEVYLHVDGTLLPFYPDLIVDQSDFRVFKVGRGATGTAYKTGRPCVVVGDAVSSGEFGLTRQQQHAFRDYDVVVSVPIKMEGDAVMGDPVVGVLSLIANDNDHSYVEEDGTINEPGMDALNGIALRLGIAFDGFDVLG